MCGTVSCHDFSESGSRAKLKYIEVAKNVRTAATAISSIPYC
jgi:hypothetical protein